MKSFAVAALMAAVSAAQFTQQQQAFVNSAQYAYETKDYKTAGMLIEQSLHTPQVEDEIEDAAKPTFTKENGLDFF